MSDDAYDLVRSLPKGAGEELRIGLSEYRGSVFVDVRVFADMGREERQPTRKGITVRLAALDDLLDALAELRDRAERRGLIGGGR